MNRACDDAPLASTSAPEKRATAQASASAWESARCRAATCRAFPAGLCPLRCVMWSVGKTFLEEPCFLKRGHI